MGQHAGRIKVAFHNSLPLGIYNCNTYRNYNRLDWLFLLGTERPWEATFQGICCDMLGPIAKSSPKPRYLIDLVRKLTVQPPFQNGTILGTAGCSSFVQRREYRSRNTWSAAMAPASAVSLWYHCNRWIDIALAVVFDFDSPRVAANT